MRRAAGMVVLLAWLLAHEALAQSKVVVLSFEGPGAARVRDAAVEALGKGDGFQVVKEAEARSAAESSSADLSTEAGRVAVARQLALSAVIEGEVAKHGKDLELSVRVFNGRDGALLGDKKFRASRDALARHVKKNFWSELGSTLARAQPPEPAPEPTPEPAPTTPVAQTAPPPPPAREAEPAAELPTGPRPSALELGASVRVLTRNYSYSDALLKAAVHSLEPTPALRIEARWYPAAHFTRSFVSNLGLDLHAQMMWPVDAIKGSAAFKTTSTAFGIAGRLRIPLANHQLGVLAGYGVQSLTIADAKGVDPGVPSVAYGFVRLGADGRFMLSQAVSLGVRAAYLVLTGFGELGQSAWFPHASGGGVEAELSLGYDLSQLLAVNLGAGMTRYFLKLNPEVSDPGVKDHGRIAGGVADQYFYGLLGLTLRL
jgi:hypothetical protein